MVAALTLPDNTTQNGAAYKSNIDGAFSAGSRIDIAFLPQAQSTPNMTVKVLAGALFVNGALVEVAAQNTGTITAPVTNPRIDRVVIDAATGAVSVVTGSEAVSPTAPAIPSGKLPICRFQLATSTTAITNSMIVDERVGTGSGSSSDDSFADVASASTVDLGAQTTRVIRITGTTAITSFGSTASTRKRFLLRFAGSLTLTYNATSLITQTGASIVTQAGDTCEAIPLGSGNWVVVNYARANGQALVGSTATVGTVVATTSGTSIDFTGISANAKMIIVSLNGVSTNGTGAVGIQLGKSAGIETAGYLGTQVDTTGAGASNFSSGFFDGTNGAAVVRHGIYIFVLVDASTNTWAMIAILGFSNSAAGRWMGGTKALAGTLDRVRLTTSNGTDTFDAGSVNILVIT